MPCDEMRGVSDQYGRKKHCARDPLSKSEKRRTIFRFENLGRRAEMLSNRMNSPECQARQSRRGVPKK